MRRVPTTNKHFKKNNLFQHSLLFMPVSLEFDLVPWGCPLLLSLDLFPSLTHLLFATLDLFHPYQHPLISFQYPLIHASMPWFSLSLDVSHYPLIFFYIPWISPAWCCSLILSLVIVLWFSPIHASIPWSFFVVSLAIHAGIPWSFPIPPLLLFASLDLLPSSLGLFSLPWSLFQCPLLISTISLLALNFLHSYSRLEWFLFFYRSLQVYKGYNCPASISDTHLILLQNSQYTYKDHRRNHRKHCFKSRHTNDPFAEPFHERTDLYQERFSPRNRRHICHRPCHSR